MRNIITCAVLKAKLSPLLPCLWQSVVMPKNRHMTFSDQQAEKSRLQKLKQVQPPPVPSASETPAEPAKPVAKTTKPSAPAPEKKAATKSAAKKKSRK
jgi:hypothetical protein